MDYWKEAVSCALDEAGITASDEQIEQIAGAMESSHENYGMAFGHDCIPNPLQLENARLSRELRVEREKIVCKECKGKGRIISHGPYHSSDTQCWVCRGEGKVSP